MVQYRNGYHSQTSDNNTKRRRWRLTRSPLLLVLRSLGVFKYGRGYAKNVSRFWRHRRVFITVDVAAAVSFQSPTMIIINRPSPTPAPALSLTPHQRQTTMQYYSLTGIAANHPSQLASPPLFTTCPVLSTITLLSVSAAVARVPPRLPLPPVIRFQLLINVSIATGSRWQMGEIQNFRIME